MHVRKDDIATAKDEWETPPELFKKLDTEFGIDLDAACTPINCKDRNHYGFTKSDNALSHDWVHYWMMDNGEFASTFYLNPPYSNGMLEKFMKKAYLESLKGAIVVCLVPFSGAGWFKRWCMKAYEIRIIGRVRFVGYKKDGTQIRNTPTFDSCIVVFDAEKKKRLIEDQLDTPLLRVF